MEQTKTANSNEITFPLYEKYVARINKQKSEHTVRSYVNTLQSFFNYFTIENVGNIAALTRDDYDDYLQYLQDTGLKESSVNNHLRGIRAFVNWLEDGDHITVNAINKVKSLKEPKVVRAIITDEEFGKMVEACETLQEVVMLYVMRYGMLRREEMTTLEIDDFREGKKLLVRGKGDKEREVPLNPYTIKLLEQYLSTRKDDSEFIFVSERGKHKVTAEAIRQRIKKIATDAGLPEDRVENISCHSFRRTGATEYLNNGVDSLVVKDLLGHSSVATTSRYIQNSTKAMEKAVNSQHVVGD